MSEKNKISKETVASFLSQNTCFYVTADDLTMLEDGAAYSGKYDIYVAQREWCTLIAAVVCKGAITYQIIVAPGYLEKTNRENITKTIPYDEILGQMRRENWFEIDRYCVSRIDTKSYLYGYGVLAFQYESTVLVAVIGKDGKYLLEKIEF